jgi:hypothetical protein
LQRLLRVGAKMPVGDKEATVVACVNAALKARGYNPPYDLSKAMNGNPVYGYQPETMIMFHRRVKTCLAAKGYAYTYTETMAYMNQTLVMTLAQIYAAIDVKTAASAPVTAASAGGALFEASDEGTANKRSAKKAAKPRNAKARAGSAKKETTKKKKKAKKTVSPKKAAPKKSGKKKPAARKRKRN